MIELIRTGDAVFLSYLQVRLDDAGIKSVVLDRHTADAYAGALGSVGARVMVGEDDHDAAKRVLVQIQTAVEPPPSD